MMVAALYDDLSIEIEGSADALRKLSLNVIECEGVCRVVLPKFPEESERGLKFADELTIIVEVGQVNITRAEKQIVISGSKEKLVILAQNILWLADQVKVERTASISDHIHIDYYPGHFFLAEDALPLIVTLQEIEV
jgi:ribosomal protein L30E